MALFLPYKKIDVKIIYTYEYLTSTLGYLDLINIMMNNNRIR